MNFIVAYLFKFSTNFLGNSGNDVEHKLRSAKQIDVILRAFVLALVLSIVAGIVTTIFSSESEFVKNIGISEVKAGIIGGVMFLIISYFIIYRIFKNYCLKGSACPQCGESFCTEIINEKTLTESIAREKNNSGNGYKNYRVGRKLVGLECQKCNFKSEVEVRFKEEA
ncbi:hypothetical protein OQH61_03940 [Helicobacter sp. MIT 21-1697]|uniref:hypothetical protein n=1 Tax=Helicobacter sp. MIT 21-1697 TaxID=2993733 RepID=UPI00224A5023|nr:hypothetical protein [Helicobacter sp. MIT 21-1697]MCX2716882.1 hypothetical protein [Helicobacter sp. MIT 21-1697]